MSKTISAGLMRERQLAGNVTALPTVLGLTSCLVRAHLRPDDCRSATLLADDLRRNVALSSARNRLTGGRQEDVIFLAGLTLPRGKYRLMA